MCPSGPPESVCLYTSRPISRADRPRGLDLLRLAAPLISGLGEFSRTTALRVCTFLFVDEGEVEELRSDPVFVE